MKELFQPQGNEIPTIFQGTREYREQAAVLEEAQATFNETAIYDGIRDFATEWHAIKKRAVRVLDLCSASGWTALHLARAVPVCGTVLVDIDREALQRASGHVLITPPIECYCESAVTFSSPLQFDVICMNSAYHHIEEKDKVRFLQNAERLLAQDGEILMGEHFLPPHTPPAFREAVVAFYSVLLDQLKLRGETEEAIAVIRRSALYCWQGVYEYKVDFRTFAKHLAESGLKCTTMRRVWPEHDGVLPPFTGSFVLRLERA